MVTRDPGGLDYPGPARYVLRRRERSALWAIFFMIAFPVPFLTMAVYGWVIRYSSVVEVIYFGLFFLLMVWCSHEMCIAAYCSEVASISPAPGG